MISQSEASQFKQVTDKNSTKHSPYEDDKTNNLFLNLVFFCHLRKLRINSTICLAAGNIWQGCYFYLATPEKMNDHYYL